MVDITQTTLVPIPVCMKHGDQTRHKYPGCREQCFEHQHWASPDRCGVATSSISNNLLYRGSRQRRPVVPREREKDGEKEKREREGEEGGYVVEIRTRTCQKPANGKRVSVQISNTTVRYYLLVYTNPSITKLVEISTTDNICLHFHHTNGPP